MSRFLNNSQLRSALAILRYLISAPASDRDYIVRNLKKSEIKSICKLVSTTLCRKDIKRKQNQKALIKKHSKVVRTWSEARKPKDFEKVGGHFKKIGGGIITSILLSLIGSAISGSVAGAVNKKK